MRRAVGIALVCAGIAASPAFSFGPIGEIVWPEYTLAVKPYDAQLSCPQLQSEIERVERDLALLRHAQIQAEEAVRIERDMRTPTGRSQSDHSGIRTKDGGVHYVETRGKIKESRLLAKQRLDHLTALVPSCKN